MCKYLTILIVCLFIVGSGVAFAEPYSEPVSYYEETGNMWFDSLNVRFVGNWPFGPSYAIAYDSSRSLAFCGSGGGVYILDVSIPSSPVKISEGIHTRGIVYGLFYDTFSQRLYIADGIAGIEIWDVSVPDSPIKLGYYDTPGYACGVYVSGSYAYVADESAGLRIVDVSTPSAPYEVGYYDTPGSAWGVYVSGSYAYVADGGALRIIDVSTPSVPYEVGYYDTPGGAYGVYVSGSYAYVADGFAGLQIYEFLGVGVEESKDRVSHSGLRLLQNPVRGNYIKFELYLTQRDDIEICLYNLLGQRVKTLSLNSLSAGKHNLKLQTKGLSSGIYFLRFEGELNNQSVKVTILK